MLINDNIIKIDTDGWYNELVSDCRAIIVERLYRSRQEVIECWHEVGERICTDENYQKYAKGNMQVHRKLASDIGKSLSSLYYAMKFYEKYPVLLNALELFEEGKNISWSKITSNYLSDPRVPVKTGELDLEPYHILFSAIMQACNSTHDAPGWLVRMGKALQQMDGEPFEGCENFISALKELIRAMETMLYK